MTETFYILCFISQFEFNYSCIKYWYSLCFGVFRAYKLSLNSQCRHKHLFHFIFESFRRNHQRYVAFPSEFSSVSKFQPKKTKKNILHRIGCQKQDVELVAAMYSQVVSGSKVVNGIYDVIKKFFVVNSFFALNALVQNIFCAL